MKTIDTPSGQLIQTCLFCKYFEFHPEWPGYSDMTPGSPMSLGCYKDHWSSDDIIDFRATMLTAQECPDYEQVITGE